MLPSIFGENLFDDMFNDAFGMMPGIDHALYGKHAKNMMKTLSLIHISRGVGWPVGAEEDADKWQSKSSKRKT